MKGYLRKMRTENNQPVDYYACFDTTSSKDELVSGSPEAQELHLNPLIGSTIQLKYGQAITCLHCGRVTKKSFSQGYCYPCFKKLPQCDLCIMSPDRCHYDQGTCRDPAWGESFCMQEHIVYLANSSGLKVGITRPSQIPTRWIDQGAMQAIPIMRVATRQQSGLVEAAFKRHVSDKTQWQQMLKADSTPQDLKTARDELFTLVKDDIEALQNQFGLQALQILNDPEQVEIQFPISQYPTKIKSLNLEKTPVVTGTLIGIKGQYLILDIGVINLRKYTSYEVEITSVD